MGRVLACALVLLATAGNVRAATAEYRVRVLRTEPMRLEVSASLPIDGRALAMAQSWPGDVPEVAEAGWPGLVSSLEVHGDDGQVLAPMAAGPNGWTLPAPRQGTVSVRYTVDYSPLAARGWPAMRETAYGDADAFIAIGRSLFITTPASEGAAVRFELPERWSATTAWAPLDDGYMAASEGALVDNLFALATHPLPRAGAVGFEVAILPFGHWNEVATDVARSVDAAVAQYVAELDGAGPTRYVVALLPVAERGGESFRDSSAMSQADPRAGEAGGQRDRLLAHELFHHWNGWTWRGADYASSQWFQEGFTEYAAMLARLQSARITPGDFAAELAGHVERYRALATPLDAPGTRKGPPLYSGGALVAFDWDTRIRADSHGARSLWDVFRALDHRLDGGRQAYAWDDIRAALDAVAPGDWDDYHARHVHGREPLPLDAALARVGLRAVDGEPLRIEPDPGADAAARASWDAMAGP